MLKGVKMWRWLCGQCRAHGESQRKEEARDQVEKHVKVSVHDGRAYLWRVEDEPHGRIYQVFTWGTVNGASLARARTGNRQGTGRQLELPNPATTETGSDRAASGFRREPAGGMRRPERG